MLEIAIKANAASNLNHYIIRENQSGFHNSCQFSNLQTFDMERVLARAVSENQFPAPSFGRRWFGFLNSEVDIALPRAPLKRSKRAKKGLGTRNLAQISLAPTHSRSVSPPPYSMAHACAYYAPPIPTSTYENCLSRHFLLHPASPP